MDLTSHDIADEIDLRAYLAVLRRRWRALVVVLLLVLLAGIGRSISQPSVYKARADLLIQQPNVESVVAEGSNSRNAQQTERELNNEVELLQSDAVVAAVEDVYDGPLDPSKVKAMVRSDSADIVTVTLGARDPVEAARLLNLYVATFIEVRRAANVDDLLAGGAEIQERIDGIVAEIAALQAPLTELETRLAADPENEDLRNQRNDLRDEIAPEVAALDSQRTFYEEQLQNVQLTGEIAGLQGAKVLREAQPPDRPVSPKPLRDGVIAVVLGLLAGVAVAFLLDNLDERIRNTTDLERATSGLATLAIVPDFAVSSERDAVVVGRGNDRSPAAEAFRSLRTSVKFAALDHPIKVIQVTSASEGEGKTTAAANLAVALARSGDRVAVVCCDLRRPRIHDRFGVPLRPGFTDVLVGDVRLSEALRTLDDNILLLPAGSPPPNPSELLSTGRAGAVISALAEEVDVVLLDCSPVLPVTDALVVSRLVDATIVVVNPRRTKRNAVRRAIDQLRHINAPILGVVLNGVPNGSGGYGYGYGYGDREDEDVPRGRRKAKERKSEPVEVG